MLNESSDGQMSESVESVSAKPRRPKASSKTTKAQWEAVRQDYERGEYSDLIGLADKHGVDYDNLRLKISRHGWKREIEKRRHVVQQTATVTMAQRASRWVEKVADRCEKDWDLCDRSLDFIGDHADPDAVLGYSRARKLLDDMMRRSLGLRDEVDVTTGGKSMGESFLCVLEKLRGKPALTDDELGKVVDVEIVE